MIQFNSIQFITNNVLQHQFGPWARPLDLSILCLLVKLDLTKFICA